MIYWASLTIHKQNIRAHTILGAKISHMECFLVHPKLWDKYWWFMHLGLLSVKCFSPRLIIILYFSLKWSIWAEGPTPSGFASRLQLICSSLASAVGKCWWSKLIEYWKALTVATKGFGHLQKQQKWPCNSSTGTIQGYCDMGRGAVDGIHVSSCKNCLIFHFVWKHIMIW